MTSASGGQRSIQLSHGRISCNVYAIPVVIATGNPRHNEFLLAQTIPSPDLNKALTGGKAINPFISVTSGQKQEFLVEGVW